MVLNRINNWVVIIIILCSTSLYDLSMAGSTVRNGAELLGIILVVVALILHLVYSEEKLISLNFVLPVVLILVSLFTSMIMALYTRNQGFIDTAMAQRAIYYYLFYFLLHQMKIRLKDLEVIFVAFGLIYVLFYFIQFFLYPQILFDSYIRAARGTIRIYLPGSAYMFLSFFLGVQYFFRTNRVKYLLLLFLILVVFVLTGGRQSLATVVLVAVIFLFFDKRVKSRFLMIFLGGLAFFAIFLLFQGIFDALIRESQSNANVGENYIRFKAAEFFVTDFFKSPLAYITGNGAYAIGSEYGREIEYLARVRQYYLGDIGIFGNYAIYGLFFILGVILFNYRALKIRFMPSHFYIKLMFITMLLSIIIAGGFAEADTICFVSVLMYMIDVSRADYVGETSDYQTNSLEGAL